MGCGSSISSATQSSSARGYAYSPPTASLVSPGECAFVEEFTAVPLLSKAVVSHDTRVFTFAVPGDPDRSLGLSTCACILAKGGSDAEVSWVFSDPSVAQCRSGVTQPASI